LQNHRLKVIYTNDVSLFVLKRVVINICLMEYVLTVLFKTRMLEIMWESSTLHVLRCFSITQARKFKRHMG